MDTGLPHLPMNRFRHLINASVDRSGVSSRCKARDVAHVNRHMYAFFMPLVPLTYTGLAKSIPYWMPELLTPLILADLQSAGVYMAIPLSSYRRHIGVGSFSRIVFPWESRSRYLLQTEFPSLLHDKSSYDRPQWLVLSGDVVLATGRGNAWCHSMGHFQVCLALKNSVFILEQAKLLFQIRKLLLSL